MGAGRRIDLARVELRKKPSASWFADGFFVRTRPDNQKPKPVPPAKLFPLLLP